MTYPDEKFYDGDWKANQPHGRGIYDFMGKHSLISCYDGGFKAGKFFGFGKLKYNNGTIIEAIFNDGQIISDFRKITTSNNSILYGCMEGNKLKDKGYLISKVGDIFYGDFNEANVPNGKGIKYFLDGSFYEGQIQDNIITGEGKFVYSNGDVYTGFFLNNSKHGKGEYIGKDFSYVGEYKNDTKCGKGIYTEKDIKYTGDFLDDNFNGYGEYQSKLEDYKGEYLNGIKNGKGVLIQYRAGQNEDLTIIGSWKNNILEGDIKISNKKGYRFEGLMSNGVKNGSGIETYENGESYCGVYKNDKKEGKGLFIFKSGDTYKGEFLNDLMHGDGLLITALGKEIRSKWSKGVMVKQTNSKEKDSCIIY